jgi:hypothetical protein
MAVVYAAAWAGFRPTARVAVSAIAVLDVPVVVSVAVTVTPMYAPIRAVVGAKSSALPLLEMAVPAAPAFAVVDIHH